MDNIILHSGVGHLDGGNSGRYPWGSGENPYQRLETFMSSYKKLKEQGMDDEAIAQTWGMPVAQAFIEASNILQKEHGKSRAEVARMWGITSTEFDAKKQIYTAQLDAMNLARARNLKEHGYSNVKIAELMGVTEGSVRNWLSQDESRKQKILDESTRVLREAVNEKNYIQVGAGVEARLGITPTKMKAALAVLKEEGYEVINVQVDQLGTGNKTTIKVLCPPGTTYRELKSEHIGDIQLPDDYISRDGGKSFYKTEMPVSLDPSRVKVLYGDETNSKGEKGVQKDGVIELRRGVDDLSLGNSNYAQVRIKVGDNLYLKGMAIYSDDIPDGYDVVFNTNKPTGTPFDKVLKTIDEEKLNGKPGEMFGATIKAGGQTYYEDPNGKFKGIDIGQDPNKLYSLSVVNKVNEEGDWDTWSRTLASQMLSKQNPQLVKQQLDLAYADKVKEFEEIKSLTNPVVKKDLLDQFANDCDASAVDLKAAAMPRQSSRVLLPVSSMKDDEIFAPDFQNGEKVVLIRYPHQGIFEIPELTVNNNQKDANKIVGKDAKDAVGISLNVAKQLSGADFDGDTVLVIPNNNSQIITQKYYKELMDFDMTKYYNPNINISDATKNNEMGKISNLITDMTLQGAPKEHVIRAVKQAMVVIDAKKHQYDYKQSAKDNNIKELEKLYQVKDSGKIGGASTIISRAKSEERVSKRQSGAYLKKDGTVDTRSAKEIENLTEKEKSNYILNSNGKPKVFYTHPETGEKLYRITPEFYTEYKIKVPGKNGKEKTDWVTKANYYKNYSDKEILEERETERLQKSTKMAEYDPKSLVSAARNPKELYYADYASKLKSMGNEARKEALNTPTTTPLSKEAKIKYANEIDSLEKALLEAKKNVPLEKQAQIIANVKSKARIEESNCADDNDKVKKIRNQELNDARAQVGADGKGTKIHISDKEWEAMNSGAISYNKQSEIIRFADKDRVRELATPRKGTQMTDAEIGLIKTMYRGGYTTAEIARRLGRSESSVRNYIDAARGN